MDSDRFLSVNVTAAICLSDRAAQTVRVRTHAERLHDARVLSLWNIGTWRLRVASQLTHLPWAKWPLFRRRYFQMHFHKWKVLYFAIRISLKFVPKGPNMRQAITWTSVDPAHRRIYVALGGDELHFYEDFVWRIFAHVTTASAAWQTSATVGYLYNAVQYNTLAQQHWGRTWVSVWRDPLGLIIWDINNAMCSFNDMHFTDT